MTKIINKIKKFNNETIEGFICKIVINIFYIFILFKINLWLLNQPNTIQNYIGIFNIVLLIPMIGWFRIKSLIKNYQLIKNKNK